ncbi:LGFP repeat-containing protein [Nocardia crassostreae]|uniref:LGFP repeat-containing protein n=1 Tax=Nocardia crassostreae TaxID=53428 RepID=UPI00082C5FFC|nr:esterase [Nocardia crassostreae]
MHHFARRTAGIIAAVAVATTFAAGCDKDSDKDSKSDASMTTTEMAPASEPMGETGGASETKIATRDGSEIAVTGDFLAKYNELGGESGPLGAPTGPEQDAPGGGKVQEFTGGAVYATSATGTHVVWGEIRKAWNENGGPGGKLGYPTTDETDIPGGKQSDFTGGTITWVDQQITVTEK